MMGYFLRIHIYSVVSVFIYDLHHPMFCISNVMHQHHQHAAGISMHKGYAFVQFTNPYDARTACTGEDGSKVLNQLLGE